MTIITRPQSKEYSDNFDRIFGTGTLANIQEEKAAQDKAEMYKQFEKDLWESAINQTKQD